MEKGDGWCRGVDFPSCLLTRNVFGILYIYITVQRIFEDFVYVNNKNDVDLKKKKKKKEEAYHPITRTLYSVFSYPLGFCRAKFSALAFDFGGSPEIVVQFAAPF